MIYVCRNPRDVCVSYFHHTKLFHKAYGYEGDFEQYADLFLKGQLQCGDYWYHLKVGSFFHIVAKTNEFAKNMLLQKN